MKIDAYKCDNCGRIETRKLMSGLIVIDKRLMVIGHPALIREAFETIFCSFTTDALEQGLKEFCGRKCLEDHRAKNWAFLSEEGVINAAIE